MEALMDRLPSSLAAVRGERLAIKQASAAELSTSSYVLVRIRSLWWTPKVLSSGVGNPTISQHPTDASTMMITTTGAPAMILDFTPWMKRTRPLRPMAVRPLARTLTAAPRGTLGCVPRSRSRAPGSLPSAPLRRSLASAPTRVASPKSSSRPLKQYLSVRPFPCRGWERPSFVGRRGFDQRFVS